MEESFRKELAEGFLKLVQVIAKLRDPDGGCPWDLEQTRESLKPFIVEEAYEVLEAIDRDLDALPYELGDLLLQVVLQAQVASDEKKFTIKEVIDHLTEKLIYRHPHVFGDVEANTAGQVLKNWERLKQRELEAGRSILDGVPTHLPALLRAQRIGEKAARVGFEWRRLDDIKDKVLEEVREFIESSKDETKTEDDVKEEFGDILFALTQLARRLKVDSEDLLQKATDKFARRFKEMEKRAPRELHEHSLDELDALWEDIKKEERIKNAARSE